MTFFSSENSLDLETPGVESSQINQHTSQTLLRPENCTSSSRIRGFLRLSRLASDDSIRQRLNEIDVSKCDQYFKETILPEWRARTEAIEFCSGYAKSLRAEARAKETTISADVDLRVDPYALKNAQNFLDNQYALCASVENWVANEINVENIIREQTASVLSEKCYYKEWASAFYIASKK